MAIYFHHVNVCGLRNILFACFTPVILYYPLVCPWGNFAITSKHNLHIFALPTWLSIYSFFYGWYTLTLLDSNILTSKSRTSYLLIPVIFCYGLLYFPNGALNWPTYSVCHYLYTSLPFNSNKFRNHTYSFLEKSSHCIELFFLVFFFPLIKKKQKTQQFFKIDGKRKFCFSLNIFFF